MQDHLKEKTDIMVGKAWKKYGKVLRNNLSEIREKSRTMAIGRLIQSNAK